MLKKIIFWPTWISITISLFVFLTACNRSMVRVDITPSHPKNNNTEFSQALTKLGLMSEIYDTAYLNIQIQDLADQTGSSFATGAEIPENITLMTQSTINSIGGRIRFIPEASGFIIDSANAGYSAFKEKLIPNALIQGGITEFDRALETQGKAIDLGLEASISKNPIALEWGNDTKHSWSRITLDFNLLSYSKMAGFPGISTSNTVMVQKGLAEDSLGFSISGNSIGLKGTLKKIEGRHAATRLLVQMSIIQLIGRKLLIPYWRLLPNTSKDTWVLAQVSETYNNSHLTEKIRKTQELLVLHGYEVDITGLWDEKTINALSQVGHKTLLTSKEPSSKAYLDLFESLPLNSKTIRRRDLLMAREATPVSHNLLASITHSKISKNGNIEIGTTSDHFFIGDSMWVIFKTSKPLFVKVFVVNNQGVAETLFPNIYQPYEKVPANTIQQIPPNHVSTAIEVVAPPGIDHIWAFTSHTPFSSEEKFLSQSGELTDYAKSLIDGSVSLRLQVTKRLY